MHVRKTDLDGLLLIEPHVWRGPRGFFFEAYNQRDFAKAGIDVLFVQDNHSRSKCNTLRGMHYQISPHAQDKLVRVLSGEIFDAVVDCRHGSPTFGQWAGFRLSASNHLSLFVPKGFAHGFCVTGDSAEVLYKCSDFYAPDCERGFCWNDPDVNIQWPVNTPLLSDRDSAHPRFAELPRDFEMD